MAEVTGTVPMDYGAAESPQPTGQSGLETQTHWRQEENGETDSPVRQVLAEFIGTFAFVSVAVCTTYWWYPDFVAMGLACGLTVAVLVSAFSRLGSGQFNPAITLGLLMGGRLSLAKAMMILPAQIISAVLACFILSSFLGANEKMNWIEPGPINETTGQQTATMKTPIEAATPFIPARMEIPKPIGQVAPRRAPNSQRVSVVKAIVIEVMLTFFWGLAVFAGLRNENRQMAGFLVGAAVAVGLLCGGILTGAVMNPVRAFGPAVVSGQWDFQLIYWIGPMLGGAMAGVVCGQFLFRNDEPV
ncbi:MAG: aquaporin [Verrucomicrobiota bacterium]|nr:aquaporin [Verrucomicrobiota bacterium]